MASKKKSVYDDYRSLSDIFDEQLNNYTEHIPTGFEKLDEILDGGLPAALTVLGGISGLGKTTLSLQIAYNIAARGEQPVIYFSLEMPSHEIILKLIQHKVNITDSNDISKDCISSDDIKRFLYHNENKDIGKENEDIGKEKSERLNKAIDDCKEETESLFIVERPKSGEFFSAEDICGYVNNLIENTSKKPVVFVDYLQILGSEGKYVSDKTTVDKNIQDLWRLANNNKIPVVVLSSLNRDAYNKAISFSAFKESGSIEYSADVVLGMQFAALHGKKAEDKDFNVDNEKRRSPMHIETVVLKHRYGKSHGYSFFNFYPAISSFIEEDVDLDKEAEIDNSKPETKKSAATTPKKKSAGKPNRKKGIISN